MKELMTGWRRGAVLTVLALGVVAAGCRAPAPKPAVPEAIVSATPANVHAAVEAAMQYHDSGQYLADLARVTQAAATYLAQQVPVERAQGRRRLAAVFDVDETSLSNWPALRANQFAFILNGDCNLEQKGEACGLIAWLLKAQDRALAPTLDLYRVARALNVAVFFVTGRRDDYPRHRMRSATQANLRAQGYADWQAVILRPGQGGGSGVACDRPTTIGYKRCVRQQITAQGYTILINIGDQWSDLAGGYAERRFLLPNPFYFVP